MDREYIERLREANERTCKRIRENSISTYINLFSIEAITLGLSYETNGDLKNAQEAYAIAYGLNNAKGYKRNLVLCDIMMRRTGADESDLPNLHSFGNLKASKLINLINMLVDSDQKPTIIISKTPKN